MRRLIFSLVWIVLLTALVMPQGLIVVQRRASSSTPALPSFTSVVGAWGLHNFNPVGYSAGNALQAAGDNQSDVAVFDAIAPYPADIVDIANPSQWGAPPYALQLWYDQNGNANNLNPGPTSPTLQITTPVVVSGAGTSAANGTYTYRGQDGNGFSFYTLTGTNPLVSAISFDSGNGWWSMFAANGDELYHGNNGVSFPWQDLWDAAVLGTLPVPTVSAGTQTGELDFNGTSTGLATAANVTLGVQTATIYVRFKSGSLAETSVVFESGSGSTANKGAISIRMVGGILTASVSDQTAVVALLNTRVKTISDSNWHVATITIDTTQSAANQVKLLVDNSATGVTATITSDLASENLTTSKFNVGARNGAASAFFTGSLTDLLVYNIAQTPTQTTAMYNYIIQVLYP